MAKPRKHRKRGASGHSGPPIPGAGVTPERLARGPVGTEAAIVSDKGVVMVLRQVVQTPLAKLLKQGTITAEEAGAGKRLRDDFDRAYQIETSPMAGEAVDGASPDPHGRILRRAHFGWRYSKALAALGPLSDAALVGIVHADTHGHGAFMAVGAMLLPGANPGQQVGAGKGALAQVARTLARFYRGR